MSVILDVENMVKTFRARGQEAHAVDDVSFQVREGTTFGLVGESGSGKSTVARCALRLITPTSGTSRIDGEDLASLTRRQLREKRRAFGIVFQNPVAALNPG
ncbi:ATP-binding cassette domain-containing protein [Microbacterium sp. NIBRBAC000506063]|uniref:ATP-binding cassette domain-containing protein n=1 Tax=Microbacterium sp. NIBRBAC000506063 TaxID=2734618 RepID=UPI001BB4C5C5|nr:ATP-binding cassette domain-containing protein [Microbacterium sp. NIBRBAC000506063]QTV79949.1 ATP-binding cassette domain-containing protein [Microbacterium sp. NIBRBAC000506063]